MHDLAASSWVAGPHHPPPPLHHPRRPLLAHHCCWSDPIGTGLVTAFYALILICAAALGIVGLALDAIRRDT